MRVCAAVCERERNRERERERVCVFVCIYECLEGERKRQSESESVRVKRIKAIIFCIMFLSHIRNLYRLVED